MVKKKKKKGEDSSDSDDCVVFESDESITEPSWSDCSSDTSDSESSDDDTDRAGALVINIKHVRFNDSSDSDDCVVFESDESITEPSWSDCSSDTSDSESSDDDTDRAGTLVINIKHVRFNEMIITHVIEIEDRKGYWAEDRSRFQSRAAAIQTAISFIFDEMHRNKMRLIVNLSINRMEPLQFHANISRRPTTIMYMPTTSICEPQRPRMLALPAPTWWRA